MSEVFNLDGKEYSTELLSDSAKALVASLKSEMLSTKAGFDFSD